MTESRWLEVSKPLGRGDALEMAQDIKTRCNGYRVRVLKTPRGNVVWREWDKGDTARAKMYPGYEKHGKLEPLIQGEVIERF